MQYLKQSTAITLKIGPFLDDTDGKTAETGLTITQADVRLSKNGANIAQKTEATSCTHDELGIYGCPIDATDTATLGRLQLWVHESGALPVFHEYMVVTANFYDSVCGTDVLQADMTQMGGVAQSATDLKDFADAGYDPATNKVQGVVLTDTVTTYTGNTKQTANNNTILAHADYGLAKLVRSTTPANALDVSATGEAGLDFANIKNATGAHTLTNITVPTVTTLTGHTAQTGDSYARLGAPAGASVSADILTIDNFVDEIESRLTAARAGYLDELAAANLPADIDAILLDTGTDGVLLAATATSAQLIDDVWDELLTGTAHNIATSAGRRLREIAAFAIYSGTAASGTAVTITLNGDASATDGIYNRNLLAIVAGTGAGQTRQVADYVGATKVVTVDREWRVNPDNTSEFVITASNVFALVDQGQAQNGTATTITLRSYASGVNDTYLCNQVVIIAGTGRGQCRLIGGYVGATKVATICGDNWVTTPDATSTYVLLPYGTTCTSCMSTHALAQVNTECDTALTDYDPPTDTEMVAAFTEIKGGTWAAGTDTLEHIRNKETDIETDTAEIGTPAGASIAADLVTIDNFVDELESRLTAARAGYLDELAAANLPTDIADIPTVAEFNARTIAAAAYFDPAVDTVTVGTNSDKTGYALTAAGIDSIIDEVIEGTLTLRQILRLLLSALAEKSSGGGTATIIFRDHADLKARITATVDANGNRTAVALDGA